MERPAQPTSTRMRRSTTIALSIGTALVLVGVAVFGAAIYGSSLANEGQTKLDVAIDQLEVPATWAATGVDRRKPGFAGLCLTTVVDVRTCDEASLSYSLSAVPTTKAEVVALLPANAWEETLGECATPPMQASGTISICGYATTLGDYSVSVAILADADGGKFSKPIAVVNVSKLPVRKE